MSHRNELKKLGFLNVETNAPIARIQAELDRSITRTHYRELAEHLKAFLGIGDGRDIVPLIGNGMERNNLEALITWATSHGEELNECSFSQQLGCLAKELKRALDNAVERYKMD